MKGAYYNEFDPYAAAWLRNLIAKNLIPPGEVDERSITDVAADDLTGFGQCHFFAGIGGWALAARLAGWPDDRELWTGSPPCQPFSVAGKQRGADDERHLWPHYFRLIRARRPAVCMGEQVAAAVGKGWLDGVLSDLEGIGYAGRAVVVPACAVDGPHRRDRLWFVAHDRVVGHGVSSGLEGLAGNDNDPRGWPQQDRPAPQAGGCGPVANSNIAGAGEGRQQRGGELGGVGGDPGACAGGAVADARLGRCGEPGARQVQQPGRTEVVGGGEASAVADGKSERRQPLAGSIQGDVKAPDRQHANGDYFPPSGRKSNWGHHAWIIGHDGKARRVEPSIRLLAHGVPARVGRLRAYGNAIVPQVAAEVIKAYMECLE